MFSKDITLDEVIREHREHRTNKNKVEFWGISLLKSQEKEQRPLNSKK